jgi:hypothetical protein
MFLKANVATIKVRAIMSEGGRTRIQSSGFGHFDTSILSFFEKKSSS